jgi:hypothetical protein
MDITELEADVIITTVYISVTGLEKCSSVTKILMTYRQIFL